jgi:hypothetical protein
MRYQPKFEPTLLERPEIFSIKILTAYAGGSRKVWGRIVQEELYKDIFVKIDPIGMSYSFITNLSLEELQSLYSNDIKRRLAEGGKKSGETRRNKNLSN